MIKIKKYYKGIICLLLCVILTFVFIFMGLFDKSGIEDKLSVRTISLEQTTNGEKINLLLEQFNTYEATNTDTTVGFEGEMPASFGEILGFDSLSNKEDSVIKKLSTTYDYETNTFYMNVAYYADDILLETVAAEVELQYDIIRDDGYVEYNGERFYFSEVFDVDSLNECVAGVDDVIVLGGGAVIVGAVLITLAVTPPSVHQEIIHTVTNVVETVVETVKSFFGWFTSWITQVFTRTTTVTTTTVVSTYTPCLSINGEDIETKEVSLSDLKKDDLYPLGAFYLCFVSSGKIYISILPIDDAEAVAILASGIVMMDENTGKEMLASTFTRARNDAYRVTVAAGLNPRTPYEKPEYEHGAYHYHSSIEVYVNGVIHSPHSFFIMY